MREASGRYRQAGQLGLCHAPVKISDAQNLHNVLFWVKTMINRPLERIKKTLEDKEIEMRQVSEDVESFRRVIEYYEQNPECTLSIKDLDQGDEVWVRAKVVSPVKDKNAIAYVHVNITDDAEGATLEVLKSDLTILF